MRNKIFYIFLGLWLISFLFIKLFSITNLIVFGIFLKLIAEKMKTGSYPLYSLVIALGIVIINLMIGLGIIFRIINL